MIEQFLRQLKQILKRLDAMRNVCIGIKESERFLESDFFI